MDEQKFELPENPAAKHIEEEVAKFKAMGYKPTPFEFDTNPYLALQMLDKKLHYEALPKGFVRVKVGKLVVPKSFDEHLVKMAELLHIRVETFYQGLMMEALNIYIERLGRAEVVLEKIRSQAIKEVEKPSQEVENE